MAPLKQGSRVRNVLGIRECVWRCKGRIWGVMWHPCLEYLPNRCLCTWLLVVVGCWYPAGGGGGGIFYLSWSAGVSCRIWSNTYGSWYLPNSCLKRGHLPNEDGFFDVSCCVLCLPVDYVKQMSWLEVLWSWFFGGWRIESWDVLWVCPKMPLPVSQYTP